MEKDEGWTGASPLERDRKTTDPNRFHRALARSHTFSMPQVLANGVSLYYEEHGSGEPIVCIHGTSGSAAVWGPGVDRLAARGRTVVYDRRGCSRSERPEPYVTNVHEQADDAAALIDALGAAPAIVIGRSYGGEIAIDLALRYPDRVRALVLLEASLLELSESTANWAATAKQRVYRAAEDGMDSVAETLLRTVAGDATWEGFPESVKQMLTANGPAIVAELRGGFLDVTAEDLGAIAQPTLLVAAEDSPPAFAEVTRLMTEAMPSARLAWTKGGHLVDVADPVVLSFVDEVLGDGRSVRD
jgi:esterase